MIALRPAEPGDADAIATIFETARTEHLGFLPVLHAREEDVAYFRRQIEGTDVTLAVDEAGPVGFIATEADVVSHLYVAPDRVGQGIGGRLLDHVMAGAGMLELWCFQANMPARRFYEARGFRAVECTDGAGNEEKTPDIRYAWRRPG